MRGDDDLVAKIQNIPKLLKEALAALPVIVVGVSLLREQWRLIVLILIFVVMLRVFAYFLSIYRDKPELPFARSTVELERKRKHALIMLYVIAFLFLMIASTFVVLPGPRAFAQIAIAGTLTPSPTITPTVNAYPYSKPTPFATSIPVMRMYNFAVCDSRCNGFNAMRTFPEKSKTLYFQWYYQNIPINAQYTRIWWVKHDGKWEQWARYECLWPGPETGLDDRVILTDIDGLHSGTWNLVIEVNHETVLDEEFTIAGDWQYWDPVIETIPNCYGILKPHPSFTPPPPTETTPPQPSLTPEITSTAP